MSSEESSPDVRGTVFDEGTEAVSQSYATALLNVAATTNETEVILGELDEFVTDIFQNQPVFASLLSEGITDQQRRDQLLVSTFEGRAHPTLLNFLRVLNRRGRLGLVPMIARIARTIWHRQNHRIPVTVRSAVPLDSEQRELLQERLVSLAGGANPMITEEVQPDLIGGLVVQIGDQLYDASIQNQLRRMHEVLLRSRAGELRTRMDLVVD
ncbi:ATP synthase F1 subunit delta [Tautonia rosea]|uniref:ATP synthase F1 subunit delta n=1 Tax=Tautonia rosea TaxID=2728037 RepID=UPI001475623D|nr:ATP synthase F1 subunit delta [Tautonia rosea]